MIVKLKYLPEEMTVDEDNCKALSEYQPDGQFAPTSSTISLELQTVLDSAARLNILDWKVNEIDDKKVIDPKTCSESLFLTRTSFFNQVRALAAEVESEFKAQGGCKVMHTSTSTWVDVQMAYSEAGLDKIFELFGGRHVDTKKLESMIELPTKSSRGDAQNADMTESSQSDGAATSSRPTSARSGTFSSQNLRYPEELGDLSNSLYLSPSATPGETVTRDSARSGNFSGTFGGSSPFPFLAPESPSSGLDEAFPRLSAGEACLDTDHFVEIVESGDSQQAAEQEPADLLGFNTSAALGK